MLSTWIPSQEDIPPALRRVLLSVEKPARYVGGEWNAVHKDWDSTEGRMALVFPDVYEIGMSFLGFRVLYHLLNADKRFLAERAYCPWPDMEKAMRSHSIPAHTLESFTPLKSFDVVGFTLQTEMAYTNILTLLDLAGIPLNASERGEEDPLVVGGGPCSFNPEPIAPFFDAVLLGDGEQAVLEMMELLTRLRKEGASRHQRLERLAGLPGFYVPSFYDVSYHPDGTIASVRPNHPAAPPRVSKRTLVDLDLAPCPVNPILPNLDIVHDRIQLEVFRGCVRGCRFCQAGMTYRPVRERRVDKILEAARASMANTGYEEISLISLSTADYTGLDALIDRMAVEFTPNNVAISSGSLRVDSQFDRLFQVINRVKKTGFTFAPEAGTDRLRKVINKNITEGDILSTMERVFSNGWDLVKLYFMFGLPTETDEDLKGLLDLVRRVKSLGRKVGGSRKQVNTGVSCFVPKPFTPFQWCAQDRWEEIDRKNALLCRGLNLPSRSRVAPTAKVEALLALGDRRVATVIRRAWKKGARFDGWTDLFQPPLWVQACEETALDWKFYTDRPKPRGETLPWDHLFQEMDKDFLWNEWELAQRGEEHGDCRWEGCLSCGVCSPERGVANDLKESVPLPAAPPKTVPRYQEQVARVRVRFAKEGRARYLSHLTVIRVFQRALHRIQAPLSYSGGFSRRPRTSFSPPPALGVESVCEAADLTFYEPVSLENLARDLAGEMPSGFRVLSVSALPLSAPSATLAFGEATYRVVFAEKTGSAALREDAARFLSLENHVMELETGKGRRVKDVRKFVRHVEVLDEGGEPFVDLTVDMTSPHSVKLDRLLQAVFPARDWDPGLYRACRIRLVESGKNPTEPPPIHETA